MVYSTVSKKQYLTIENSRKTKYSQNYDVIFNDEFDVNDEQ